MHSFTSHYRTGTQMTQASPPSGKVAPAGNGVREELIQNLYTWGPALTGEIRAKYPSTTVRELVRAKVLARKKFTGFEVYLLSGVGLRPYGYSMRYNYIPAKNVVLGALVVRAMARQYENEGYTISMFDGYAKRGRDNLLIARKSNKVTIIIGRASMTMKSVRQIVSSLQETFPKVAAVHVAVIQGDHDPVLVNATSVNDVPLTLIQLPMTRITREDFGVDGDSSLN